MPSPDTVSKPEIPDPTSAGGGRRPSSCSENCSGCGRPLEDGENDYICEVCGHHCCTACSDTTMEHDVVCDECLDCGYDDAWPQGRGFTSQNESSPSTDEKGNDHE